MEREILGRTAGRLFLLAGILDDGPDAPWLHNFKRHMLGRFDSISAAGSFGLWFVPPDLRCSVAQVGRFTKVYATYDEYKTVNTKVPNAKVYPREILQAFKELEAIQPPPGFAEYQQRVKRADKKFEDACKRHGLDSLRVIMDFRLS